MHIRDKAHIGHLPKAIMLSIAKGPFFRRTGIERNGQIATQQPYKGMGVQADIPFQERRRASASRDMYTLDFRTQKFRFAIVGGGKGAHRSLRHNSKRTFTPPEGWHDQFDTLLLK